MPVASSSMRASPYSAGWPLASSAFEAESGSLARQLTPCASQGFGRPVARTDRLLGYMCHRHLHGDPLPVTRETRLSLAHRTSTNLDEWGIRAARTLLATSRDQCFLTSAPAGYGWLPERPSQRKRPGSLRGAALPAHLPHSSPFVLVRDGTVPAHLGSACVLNPSARPETAHTSRQAP